MSLIDLLVRDGWLKTEAIINAFKKIKRQDFMPAAPIGSDPRLFYGREDLKNLAELNEALPIGEGQTISQPLTVAFMLELLQPKEGDKILDVGSGSGWTTALLAYIVSQKGNSKSKIRNSKQIQNSKS
jgi:protein-L-isoaspartate(D-aspartate) O-methyltransferase